MTRFFAPIVAVALTTAVDAQKPIAHLTASDAAPNDLFGSSVSIGGDTAIVGAPLEGCPADCHRGSVYIFRAFDDVWVQMPAACPADLDGDGSIDFGDLLAVLTAWSPCGDCPEDLDGSGDIDFGDLLILLSAWGPCP